MFVLPRGSSFSFCIMSKLIILQATPVTLGQSVKKMVRNGVFNCVTLMVSL